MSHPITIAIDFDGVIHRYSKGWQDGSIYDPPHPGAKEALEALTAAGFEIVIYTTRAYDRVVRGVEESSQSDAVADYLRLHQIPFDRVHTFPGKPLCKLFIDDNALRFEGDWATTLAQALRILQPKV